MHIKTFLVTGASKGIGYATCLRLATSGHQIIGVARNIEGLAFPGKLFQADLTDEKETAEIFNTINELYDIDGIVNNVGGGTPAYLAEITLTDLRATLEINLRTALQAMQVFAPKMIANNWGRVVNVASRAVVGRADISAYAAAKAGLIAFTRCWALEFLNKGITVNAVAPGPIETENYRRKRPIGSEAEKISLARIPMGRVGTPNEVAATIEFFLQEDSAFITGQTLFVDGGGSIGGCAF